MRQVCRPTTIASQDGSRRPLNLDKKERPCCRKHREVSLELGENRGLREELSRAERLKENAVPLDEPLNILLPGIRS
jgi:hypothetical protein